MVKVLIKCGAVHISIIYIYQGVRTYWSETGRAQWDKVNMAGLSLATRTRYWETDKHNTGCYL